MHRTRSKRAAHKQYVREAKYDRDALVTGISGTELTLGVEFFFLVTSGEALSEALRSFPADSPSPSPVAASPSTAADTSSSSTSLSLSNSSSALR